MNNGGYAFPIAVPKEYDSTNVGMTLRDYLAAKALTAIISTVESMDILTGIAKQVGKTPEEIAAIQSYNFADAMLKAREVQP